MKLKILLFLCSSFILFACNNENEPPRDGDHFYTNYGVDYFMNGFWQHVHGKEIDITGMPNEFTLEFKTFGVHEISPIGNDISITILDPLGENEREPIEFSEDWKSFIYLQKFLFKTNGEKTIKVKFLYKYWNDVSECTCTLVRKD